MTDNSTRASAGAQVKFGFDGLNHRAQRTANGGNQFSVEPPDQGLCVGNGFVFETVNTVLRVFDKQGNPLTGVVDLNSFYGYAAQVNRTTGEIGPFTTDPSCYFDADTQRWFHVILTLEVDPVTGDFLGPNHLDLAVSKTANPTGEWTIYQLPVQDDGTDGTPDHNCAGGPCIGDYPHLGADATGFYLTTNEYPLFEDGFHGAQIYAFSKRALARGDATVTVTQFDTAPGTGNDLAGDPGFTIWPAIAPGGHDAKVANGSEFFLSSNAAEEANGDGTSSSIGLWALTNTKSLDSAHPDVRLDNRLLHSQRYSQPPLSNQKPGDIPLGECLNDTDCATFLNGEPDPFAPEVESVLDSNDTRMQQTVYVNGQIWGALDTAVKVKGTTKAGIAWFMVLPVVTKAGLFGAVIRQDTLGIAGNNLTYPTVGSLSNGRGIISFTVLGDDFYPSVGYVTLSLFRGDGPVRLIKQGAGPDDGFTSYKYYVGDPPRTRWGDYGAAATDGASIWIGTEYIAQTCTLEEYLTPPVGSCGGTRTALGNWATRITQINP